MREHPLQRLELGDRRRGGADQRRDPIGEAVEAEIDRGEIEHRPLEQADRERGLVEAHRVGGERLEQHLARAGAGEVERGGHGATFPGGFGGRYR